MFIRASALAASDSQQPKLPPGVIPDAMPPLIPGDDLGYLPGSVGVADDGAFTYEIPLDVPAGRAGMQPSLSLHYSSSGGNGVLGVGWNVSGTSEITRCAKSLNTDGVVDGVDFDDTDALCLDGQRLVAIQGAYGANGTEYRTRNDLFARIVGEGVSPLGTDTFKVWTRSGRILTFTANDTPRVVGSSTGVALVESPSIAESTARTSWTLARQEDRAGNAMTYEYELVHGGPQDAATEIVLSKISYTSHANGEPAYREVRFVYEARPDTSIGWSGGIASQRTKRLRAIEMYAPNPVSTSKVWDYAFEYEAGTSAGSGRSLLHSVKKCAFNGGCLWAKQFDWTETAPQPLFDEQAVGQVVLSTEPYPGTDAAPGPFPPLATKAAMKIFDFDGDGADDILYRLSDMELRHYFKRSFVDSDGMVAPLAISGAVNETNALPPNGYTGVNWSSIRPISGDGGAATLWVEGNSSHATLAWNPMAGTFTGSWLPGESLLGTGLFADFDGDRRISVNERVHVEDVADHAYPDDEEPEFRLLAGGAQTTVGPGCPLRFTDLDGDGRTEVLTRDNTAAIGCEGDMKAIGRDDDGQIVAYALEFPEAYEAAQFSDFNGDGLADALLLPGPENETLVPELWWNTGNGFYPSGHSLDIPHDDYALDDWGNSGDIGIRLADMNRDGRTDIVSFHQTAPAGITILFSNGDGSFRRADYDLAPGTPIPNNDGTVDAAPGAGLRGWSMSQLGDFDGDGRIDIVRIVDDEMRILTQTAIFTDRIVAVFDEATAWPRETVTYSNRLDERPVHTSCSYPLACIRKGLTVVRSIQSYAHWTEASVGGEPYVVEYSYADPVVDLRGGGFLGFGERRVWDPQQPAETIATFDHRIRVADPYDASNTRALYPYAGRPKTVTTAVPILTAEEVSAKAGNAELRIAEATSTYSLKWLNAGATLVVLPDRSETKTYEHSGFVDWTDDHPLANTSSRHVWPSGALGTPLRIVNTATTYDDFANPLSESQSTVGGVSRTTRSMYVNDTAHWLIGLPLTRQVSAAEATGSPPVTRHYEFATNAFGQIETTWVEKNNPALAQMHVSSYDPTYGFLIGETSSGVGALPRQIRYAYDALYPGAPDEKVFRSQIWAPRLNGQYVPTGWIVVEPAYGLPVLTIDVNLNMATRHYDDLGRLQRIEPAVGEPTQMSYAAHFADDGSANGVVVRSQRGGQTDATVHDALGRASSATTTGFAGEEVRKDVRYDLRGNAVAESRPYVAGPAHATLETQRSYDSLGRLLRTTAPDGSAVRHAHSFLETRTWDAADHESVVRRDIDGRVVWTSNVEDGAEIETTFDYAPFDNLERVTDAAGNEVRMEYDALGRRTRQVDSDSGMTEVIYSGLGDVMSQKRLATNEIVSFGYDDLGRLVSRIDSDGTTTWEWDTSSFGIGALASTHSPDGILRKIRYDAFGRPNANDLIDEATGETFNLDIAYDDRGRLDTLAYPEIPGRERFTVRYRYNDAGFMERVAEVDGSASGTPMWTVEARNADLALTQGRLGNGTAIQRSYSPTTGRIERMLAVPPQPAALAFDMNYEYDATGFVNRRNDLVAGRDETYGHDAMGRLRHWTLSTAGTNTATEYRYDDIGNLLDVYKNGALAEHNAYGNVSGGQPHTLTTHVDAVAGLQTSYHYDALGRLDGDPSRQTDYTAFDLPRNIVKDGAPWTFAYDADHARTKKIGPDGATLYMDGFYERRDAGGTRKHVFRVYGTDGEVAEIVHEELGGDVVGYPIQDALASTGAVMDKFGAVTQRSFFEPFGARISGDGSPFSGLIGDITRGFTGHEHDDALGLINMRGRMYDPALRRFLTADPVVTAPAFGQSWNPYSYVVNSPLNLTDPSGFTWCSSYACVYKSGSFGETLARWSVSRGYGANAGYDETYGAPQEYGSGFWEPLGSADAAAQPSLTVAFTGMPTIERELEGTPTVCREDNSVLGQTTFTCTAVREQSDRGGWWNEGKWREGSAWDDANYKYDRNAPIIGLFFEEDYPDTPAWRERRSDQQITQQGAALLVELAPMTVAAPGGTAVRVSGEGGGARNSVRRRYAVAEGTNPSGCKVNCGRTSLAGLKRLHGIDPAATVSEGREGLQWFDNLKDAVIDVFGSERVTETTARSLREVVSMMRTRPPGSTAILIEELRVGGRLVTPEGHYTVAALERTGIVRFIDFQSESAAAYTSESWLREFSEAANEAATETFRVILVDP